MRGKVDIDTGKSLLNTQRSVNLAAQMSITKRQQEVISKIVALVRSETLKENFSASFANRGGMMVYNSLAAPAAHFPHATMETFLALANAGLLIASITEPRFGLLSCALTGKAYEA